MFHKHEYKRIELVREYLDYEGYKVQVWKC